MQHQILDRPSYSLLVLQLEAGEALAAEPGAEEEFLGWLIPKLPRSTPSSND
jgi:hypothetical protein